MFTSLTGSAAEEIPYGHNNPLIELRDAEYVVNMSTISAHDNYIAMNNALSIDFSGQINAETIGDRQWNGTGGQPELHMGAVMSRGGRAITILRSTAAGGSVSRIVPQHPEGAAVTVPRTFADTIVTEYGIAQLLGKTIRERARELIAVAIQTSGLIFGRRPKDSTTPRAPTPGAPRRRSSEKAHAFVLRALSRVLGWGDAA